MVDVSSSIVLEELADHVHFALRSSCGETLWNISKRKMASYDVVL